MAAIVLQVPDESLVPKVKQVCKMIKGVVSVKVERPKQNTTNKKSPSQNTDIKGEKM